MSALTELLPPTSIAVLFVLLNSARFENQRWVRARKAGLRGSNRIYGEFVDLTRYLSWIFEFAFLIAYAVDTTIPKAVALFALAFAVGWIYTIVSSLVFRGDSVPAWIIGTIAIWPLSVALAPRVTWFGIF